MHEVSHRFECIFEKKTPWGCQAFQNEHLVILNTSGDVLVKIVKKLRGHFMHTRSGSGPTQHGFHTSGVSKTPVMWNPADISYTLVGLGPNFETLL